MVRIKNKLHSQRGASILFALLAFLGAAMVSITIIAAAVTNVKRIYSDREAQQNHLTLVSAAQLVREEMENTRYIITIVTTEVVSEDGAKSTTVERNPPSDPPIAEGTFDIEMLAAVNAVGQDKPDVSSTYRSTNPAFTLHAENMEALKDVDVSFTMSGKQYKVVFTFTLKDTNETLFLTMEGTDFLPYGGVEQDYFRSPDGKTTTTITKTKEAMTWDSAIINGIGDKYD